MPISKKNTQTGISAGGHVVGENLHDNSVHHHYVQEDPTPQILRDLFASYGNEEELNSSHDELIDELNKYVNPLQIEGKLRDLKTKLTDGGRKAFLNDALWLKDSFRREIEKYRHSPTAQEIFAYLLAAIRSYFRCKIFHAIGDMKDAELETAILEEVIEPTLKQIPSSKPLITQDTLLGMLYFLTGNCFLEWEPC